MTIRRSLSVLAALCAALLVSGCFVISTNLPAGTGPINDDALVGDWRGIDADTGKDNKVYVHFQKPDPSKPLRVVFVEGHDYQIYELQTRIVGNRKIFAAKLIGPLEATKDVPKGFFIGFYEVNGNEAVFQLLDAEKTGKLISQGTVQGTPGKAKYDFTTLTGAPAGLAHFLTSPQAWEVRAEPARLRRLPQSTN